ALEYGVFVAPAPESVPSVVPPAVGRFAQVTPSSVQSPATVAKVKVSTEPAVGSVDVLTPIVAPTRAYPSGAAGRVKRKNVSINDVPVPRADTCVLEP